MKIGKYARIAKAAMTSNHPYHAQWFLNRICNFKCKSCDVWQEPDTRKLPTEQVLAGLDKLRDLGIIQIVFSGGDPLLRPDIEEILKYSHKYFITSIYDNGSMLIPKIEALKYADYVCVSIDSLEREKFAYIRGVDQMEKAIQGMLEVQKRYGNVIVSPTASGPNVDEIPDILRHFNAFGIGSLLSVYNYPEDSDSQFKIGVQEQELVLRKERVLKLIEELIQLKKDNNRILITNKVLNTMKEYYSTGKRWTCRALDSFIMIDHLGRVSGCHVKAPVANIVTDDLKALWDSGKFKEKREEYSKCRDCTYMCYVSYSLYSKPSNFVNIDSIKTYM